MRCTIISAAAFMVLAAPAEAAPFWQAPERTVPKMCADIAAEKALPKIEGGTLTAAQVEADPSPRHLAGVTLVEGDWTLAPLAGWVLENVTLQGTSFPSLDAAGAVIFMSVFENADLSDSDFTNAAICDTRFNGASLSATSFAMAKTISADFTGATAIEADFSAATLFGAALEVADLTRANLAGAQLFCTWELGPGACLGTGAVKLDGADLDGAFLSDVAQASLAGAQAEGATFDDSSIPALAGAAYANILIAPMEFTGRAAQAFSRAEIEAALPGWTDRVLAPAASPSFDCTKASTAVEKAVCSDPDLAARDRVLAGLYKAASAAQGDGTVRAAQLAWIKRRDDACAKLTAYELVDCLNTAYDARIAMLAEEAPQPNLAGTWRPNSYFTIPTAWAGTPAGARFALLDGNATDRLTITGNGPTIAVTGETLGGNYHVCSFEGPVAWDGKGAYRETDGDSEPDDRIMLRGTATLLRWEGGAGYCGMRAAWGRVWERAD